MGPSTHRVERDEPGRDHLEDDGQTTFAILDVGDSKSWPLGGRPRPDAARGVPADLDRSRDERLSNEIDHLAETYAGLIVDEKTTSERPAPLVAPDVDADRCRSWLSSPLVAALRGAQG